jgi:hypothetical protein
MLRLRGCTFIYSIMPTGRIGSDTNQTDFSPSRKRAIRCGKVERGREVADGRATTR